MILQSNLLFFAQECKKAFLEYVWFNKEKIEVEVKLLEQLGCLSYHLLIGKSVGIANLHDIVNEGYNLLLASCIFQCPERITVLLGIFEQCPTCIGKARYVLISRKAVQVEGMEEVLTEVG